MADLEGRITLDPDPFVKGLKTATRALKSFKRTGQSIGGDIAKSFKQAAKALSFTTKVVAGTAAAFGGLGAVILGVSIKAARVQIKAERQLAAVLKSTGNAAGVTAEQVKRTATEIQRFTNFGDEAVISAQNMLLTFTKIGSEVFPRATKTVTNLASAMNIGLNQAAIQVGKALNDPIIGLTALRRVGIAFTKSQEEQIKTLTKAGEVVKAQTIILKELEVQFGGVAEANADSFTQLKNVIGDVAEEIGRALIPAFDELAEALKEAAFLTGAEFAALTQIIREDFTGVGDAVEAATDRVRSSGGLITLSLALVSDSMTQVGKTFKSVAPFVAGAITGLLTAFNILKAGVLSVAQAVAGLIALFDRDFVAINRKLEREVLKTVESIRDWEKTFGDIKKSMETAGDRLKETGGAVEKFAEKIKDAVIKNKELAEQQAAASDQAAEQTKQVNELAKAHVAATETTRQLGEATRKTKEIFDDFGTRVLPHQAEQFAGLERAAQAGREALRKLIAEGKGNTKEAEALGEAIERLNNLMGAGIEFATQLGEGALRKLGRAIRATKQEILSTADALRQATPLFNPADAAGAAAGGAGGGGGGGGGDAAAAAATGRRRTSSRRRGGSSRGRLGGFGFGIQRGRAVGRGQGGPRGFLSFQEGGFTPGGPINSEPGEFVLRRSATNALGPAVLAALNRQRPVNTTININGPVSNGVQSQVRSILPELQRAIRLGLGQGGTF